MWSGAAPRVSNRRLRGLVLTLGLLTITLYLAPMRLGVVCGESMAPTLRHGQVFVMQRLRRARPVRRGDVVVFDLNGQKHIKRVLGLAGDVISGLDWGETAGHPDYIAADSEVGLLSDLAQRQPAVGRWVKLAVPKGCVFVIGDAITRSCDSRHFGPVPIRTIDGRLIATLFTVPNTGATYPHALASEIGVE